MAHFIAEYFPDGPHDASQELIDSVVTTPASTFWRKPISFSLTDQFTVDECVEWDIPGELQYVKGKDAVFRYAFPEV